MNTSIDAQSNAQSQSWWRLNPELDLEKLSAAYAKTGRLRVRDFLSTDPARAIYRHLAQDIPWRTFLVSNERLMGTPPGEPSLPEDDRETLTQVQEGARGGFATLFDADRIHSEDLDESVRPSQGGSTVLLDEFGLFLQSDEVLGLIRRIMRVPDVARLATHAVRFGRQQFMTFHGATRSADPTGKRCASLYLNLTPTWKPEWGGLLEFRTQDADVVESFVPNFNTLDLFSFPQGYWISPVAPFADGPVLAIAGRVYRS